MVLSPAKMRVSVSDPILEQPSEIDIIRSEFTSERLEMEQKYLKLQEIVDRAENNAQVQERKARETTDVYNKVKSENEGLYIANKKL